MTVFGDGGSDTTVFFSPMTRSWELAVGALWVAAEIRSRGSIDRILDNTIRYKWIQPFPVGVRDLVASLGFTAIIASIVLFPESRTYPSWITVLLTGGAALLIAAGGGAWINRQILSHPIMVTTGLISCLLYLWHWPLISFARIALQHEPPLLMKVAIVAVALALAWVTTTYVERPIRTGRLSAFRSRTLIPVSLLAGLARVAAVGLATQWANGRRDSRYGFRSQSVSLRRFGITGDWEPGSGTVC